MPPEDNFNGDSECAPQKSQFRNMFFRALTLGFKIKHEDEVWEYTEEPHVTRRQEILKRHPEIKKLMGYDPTIALIVVAEVIVQVIICYGIQRYDISWGWLSLLAYVIGATLNHSLGSAIHEIGHNLAFGHKRGWANRVLSLIANFPVAVPMAISYKKYHADHHRWLGHDQNDVDIPTWVESLLFRNPVTKILWLIVHPVIHGVRPFFKSPKPATSWEIANFATQAAFDIAIYQIFGVKAIIYLVLGTVMGLGFHPLAGHFISEHYDYFGNQATTSYYGPLNFILFNVGYHVEHHDFPYIPHTKLAKVREIAPEFYQDLPYHTSWVKVLWDFVFKAHHGPQSRTVTLENTSHPEFYSGMRRNLANEDILLTTTRRAVSNGNKME